MDRQSLCGPGSGLLRSRCSPSKPVLVVHKGRGQIKSTLPPGEVSFGGRKFSWLAIDSLQKDGDLWVLSLLDNERFAGQPRALPGVSYGAGRTTQLATADRIEVRLENPPPTELTYEVQARRGPTVFAPIRGRLRIKDTPRGLTPSFGQPLDRPQIHEPIVIEGVVRETLIVGVVPTALVWSPTQGAPAGMEDESGRFLLVNGQPWRAAAGPSVLPILLGVRDAQIQLLWARPVGDGPHNAERVSADIQKVPMANLTSMIVKNRAAEPYRVALAITFDPPRTIDPIMPPRSQPRARIALALERRRAGASRRHRPREMRRPHVGRPHHSGNPRQWPPDRSPGRCLCRRTADRS